MKKYEELTLDERQEIIALFTNWLSEYSNDVVLRVMAKADEIINNAPAMTLLREMVTREQEEKKDFQYSIDSLFRDFDTFKVYNIHNHPLTHSRSYRDVLYDMYIREDINI